MREACPELRDGSRSTKKASPRESTQDDFMLECWKTAEERPQMLQLQVKSCTRWILVLGLFLVGCRTAQPAEDSETKIVGGKRVLKKDPIARHTVAIIDADPNIGQYCSATLVAPRVLLTAAHCFEDPTKVPLALFALRYTDSDSAAAKGTLVKIEKVAIHSAYRNIKGENYDKIIAEINDPAQIPSPEESRDDIALAYLAEEAPAGFEAAAISDSLPTKTSSLVSAGFGCMSTVCDEGQTVLKKVPISFVKAFKTAGMLLLSAGPDQGTCPGDSGGPVYRLDKAQVQLIAVVTTGPESCEAGISVDTSTLHYRGWIDAGISGLANEDWTDKIYRVKRFR